MALWRTAWIMLTVHPDELPVLEGWPPTVNGGRDWLAPEVDVLGVIEGDFSELMDDFRWMVAATPTLTGVVHLSRIYADAGVECTVSLGDGEVVYGEPSVDALRVETKEERSARLDSGWETRADAMRGQPAPLRPS